jgi:hypothetical protein
MNRSPQPMSPDVDRASVVFLEPLFGGIATLHRLADEQVADHMVPDQVERQQRMA